MRAIAAQDEATPKVTRPTGFIGRTTIATRLFVMVIGAAIGMAAIGAFALFELRENLIKDRYARTQVVVETAHSLLQHYYDQAVGGQMSEDVAQQAAMKALHGLRYDTSNYFWINDFSYKLLMHPFQTHLVGLDQSKLEDVDGTPLFALATNIAKIDGEGFVAYKWPRPGGGVSVPKVSFVKAFRPWEWVIGSGIYIDDVDQIFAQQAFVFASVGAAVLLVVFVGSLWISQSIRRPLEAVVDGMQRLTDGHIAVVPPPSTQGGEIGQLIEAMRRYKASLREAEFLRIEKEALKEREQQALQESYQRFRTVAEASPVALVVVTLRQGKVLYANRRVEEIFDLPPKELLGKNVGEYFADRGDRKTAYRALLSGKEVPELETRIVKPNGETMWVYMHAHPHEFMGEDAVMVGLIDISRRRRAEEEVARHRMHLEKLVEERTAEARKALEEADRAHNQKADFLSKMSHELRTPLNVILGLSEMLIDEAEEDETGTNTEALRRVVRAGKHLLDLINDILDLAKFEAGKMEMTLEICNVRTVIEDSAGTIASLAEQKGNRLDVIIADDVSSTVTDRVRLKQVILNLLSNACKFTKDGVITLSAAIDGDQLVLAVRDTGVGIAPDAIGELFNDFTQVDTKAARRAGGTGLGLSICQRICEALGGSISAESTLGEGSTFTCRLPLERRQAN